MQEKGKEEKKQGHSLKNLAASHPGRAELIFYGAVVVVVLLHYGYDFYQVYGRRPQQNLPVSLIKKGWLTEFRDATEDAMLSELRVMWPFILISTALFIIISQATLRLMPIYVHQLACSAYTLLITAHLIGQSATLYFLLLYCLTLLAGSASYCLSLLVILLAMLVQNMTNSPLVSLLSLYDRSGLLFYPITGYYLCRLVSIGHSMRQKRVSLRLLAQSMHYAFYLPYYYVGPITTFENFVQQTESAERVVRKDQCVVSFKLAGRLLLSLLLYEILGHLLPVSAYLTSIRGRPVYSHLVLAMYIHGQNFMLLYMQLYGWPGVAGRLDGVQLPHWPACISRVYSYREMWRVFDRGLFLILHAHIYTPVISIVVNLTGSWKLARVLGTVASFLFVDIYHGDTDSIRIWAALNAGHMLIETAIVAVYRRWLLQFLLNKLRMPAIIITRLESYFISWNLITSCGVIHVFFFESRGYYIINEFLIEFLKLNKPISSLLLFNGIAYCFVQLGRAYNNNKNNKNDNNNSNNDNNWHSQGDRIKAKTA